MAKSPKPNAGPEGDKRVKFRLIVTTVVVFLSAWLSATGTFGLKESGMPSQYHRRVVLQKYVWDPATRNCSAEVSFRYWRKTERNMCLGIITTKWFHINDQETEWSKAVTLGKAGTDELAAKMARDWVKKKNMTWGS
ncbi:hypothetical protein ES707_16527 [subsurface metagenome]